MLYELIKSNRELLLARSAKLSAENGWHSVRQTVSLGHVSVFFDQLIEALRAEHDPPSKSGKISRVTKEKFTLGKFGFAALLRDTEGNVIGLHSMQ